MTDPLGKSQHEPGAKLDAGKNRLGMVLLQFREAIEAVGEVGSMGAAKYSDGGWQHVPNGKERYLDAMFRHLFKFHSGEENDPESGLSHISHFCWNACAVATLHLKVAKEDESNTSQEHCSPVLPIPDMLEKAHFQLGPKMICPSCKKQRNTFDFNPGMGICNYCRNPKP